MHTDLIDKYALPKIPKDIPNLESLILQDKNLKYIYDANSFILKVDDNEMQLESQILKKYRDFICITPESHVWIYFKKNLLNEVCDYPDNNALYIQLLSGDTIVYGDEARNKQKHIVNKMIYKSALEQIKSDKNEYFKYDITSFINENSKYLAKENANNIFFTTTALRDYHYQKQKNNGYYHIQSMNLPFQNMEFYYLKLNEGD